MISNLALPGSAFEGEREAVHGYALVSICCGLVAMVLNT